jgi:hypothetical protein
MLVNKLFYKMRFTFVFWLIFALLETRQDEANCEFDYETGQLDCSRFETWSELDKLLGSNQLLSNSTSLELKSLRPIPLTSEFDLQKMRFNDSFIHENLYYILFHSLSRIEITNWPVKAADGSIQVVIDQSVIQFLFDGKPLRDFNCTRDLLSRYLILIFKLRLAPLTDEITYNKINEKVITF